MHAQYFQDLKEDTSTVSQQLPEAGIFLYPSRTGPLYTFVEALAGNFYREAGSRGQRVWLSPGILHATTVTSPLGTVTGATEGQGIVFSESLSLKAAHYWIHNDPTVNSLPEKERTPVDINYEARLFTALSRDFKEPEFTHIIEPSLRYIRTEKANRDEPPADFFDRRDLFERTSMIEAELLNRFIWPSNQGTGTEEKTLIIRIRESFDTLKDSWLPLTADASFRIKEMRLGLEAEYDLKEENIRTFTVKTGFKTGRLSLSLAERYSRELDLLFLSNTLDYELSQTLALQTSLWYDLKGNGLRNLRTGVSWKRQCWTLNVRYIKTPEDYSIQASIDLKGL